MQYRYAKFIATRYLQFAGERNVMVKKVLACEILISLKENHKRL
jgi:hypothetical protein